jgi:hypothetical protein
MQLKSQDYRFWRADSGVYEELYRLGYNVM